jgi:hypothetical protein
MKRNVIAIYHHPQECGSPYVALVSQETGEIVEAVDIPSGYYSSGAVKVTNLIPVYSFTEKVNQSPMPTIENVRITASYRPNPNHYVFKVTRVADIREDKAIFPTWKATVYIDACREDTHWEYDPTKDTFLKKMSELGLNMTDWELHNREKTSLHDFLTQVFSSYKDYHLVNLLEIG